MNKYFAEFLLFGGNKGAKLKEFSGDSSQVKLNESSE